MYIEMNICFQIVSYNIDSGFVEKLGIHRIFQTNPYCSDFRRKRKIYAWCGFFQSFFGIRNNSF